jgi:hypothetical protein
VGAAGGEVVIGSTTVGSGGVSVGAGVQAATKTAARMSTII